MRKLILSVAAVAALGLALPLTAPAQAEEGRIVIKTGDRHHVRDHGGRKVVICIGTAMTVACIAGGATTALKEFGSGFAPIKRLLICRSGPGKRGRFRFLRGQNASR